MISHFKGIKFRTGNQTMNEHVNISFILVFIFRFLFFCFVLFRIANVFLISHVQWILAFINISRIRNEEVTPSNNRSVILRVRSSPPELCFPLLAGYFLTLKEERNTSNDQDQTLDQQSCPLSSLAFHPSRKEIWKENYSYLN